MRSKFFDKKTSYLTVRQICEMLSDASASEDKMDIRVHDVATISGAKENDIVSLHSTAYSEKLQSSKAGFCVVAKKDLQRVPSHMIAITHPNPYYAFSKIVHAFYEDKSAYFGSQNIDNSAKIGDGTIIAPNAYIGANVQIGKNCKIGPSASIMSGCIIGDDCIVGASASISHAMIGDRCNIYPGARIGQDGFGFAHHEGVNYKVIQIGSVVIGNDVEVGSNACVDRGAIDDTVIGNQVKIDNLNQIAHNVKIGDGTVIAGCCAIAGSTEIGKFVQIGGGTQITGHIKISNYSKIAGGSGVIRDVGEGQVVGGRPALPVREWHRINANLIAMSQTRTAKAMTNTKHDKYGK